MIPDELPGSDATVVNGDSGQRLDKWLWFTRVVKSRTLAAGLIQDGKVRVNRQRVTKASFMIKIGDVVTLTAHRKVYVYKVILPGKRRGPAPEARALYEDLSPPSVPTAERKLAPEATAQREAGSGRPTKRDRRAIDRLTRDRGQE